VFCEEHLRAKFAKLRPSLSTKPHLLERVMNALLRVPGGAKARNRAHNV